LGLSTFGIDSSPIAVAIAQAKLAQATVKQLLAAARKILRTEDDVLDMPHGEFWNLAYHPETLRTLCRLRQGLLRSCESDTRRLLRAIVLGALHGPLTQRKPAYFSNQCPRTFAPKPKYAAKFWRTRNFAPPRVDALEIIERRACRYLEDQPLSVPGRIVRGDSRHCFSFGEIPTVSWVVTSPPYYGMRTYIPDQWLRHWFLGGPSEVMYRFKKQLRHTSPQDFVNDLIAVWRNVAKICKPSARLVIRFGGINDRKQQPLKLLKSSLHESGWHVQTALRAGDANDGKRQARQFVRVREEPIAEYDVYAVWKG